jgi:RNA polymerase sigma factor (sigma-70 family)
MNTTAENGFLPALTEKQILDISKREAARHATTLFSLTGDSGTTEEYIEDLAQSFALGVLEALKVNDGSRAIRTLQWNYGRGYILKRLHEIIDNINEARTPIDTSGGAFTKDEDEDATGYAPEASDDEAVNILADADDKAAAMAAFNRLEDKYQQILQLRLIEGKNFADIARIIGATSMCARLRYKYGLEQLRHEYIPA